LGQLRLRRIRASSVGSLLIEDCVVADNYADYEGGGLYATTDPKGGGTIEIRDSVFTRNEAAYEGGAAAIGIRWDPIKATIEDTVFDSNLSRAGAHSIWCPPKRKASSRSSV
jgi:hypothetical protein